MAKDVTIRVVATDQASPVFRTIGQNATQATTQIEQGNQRAARSYEDLERRAVAIGAAIGAVATGMAAAGEAANNQAQQIRGIEVAYGDASKELLQFAEQMQDVTNFSNEAARASLLTASTITQQYGIATDQVDDLVARSADLAQVFGYDLADATGRVTAAIRGEAEAAEALGIAMSDTVLQQRAAQMGLVGWNTTMTEAEKAQVRFAVLMEQTAYVSGEAQRAHESTRGSVLELANEFQDAGVKVGEFLGPLGETMSVLGSMSLVLPVVGAGLGKLVAGLSAAGLGAGVLGPLLLGGGLAYLGTEAFLNRDATGSSIPFSAVNYGFYGAGSALNAVLPGNPFNTQKYLDTLSSNDVEQVLKGLFYFNPASEGDISNQDLFERLVTAGILSPIPAGAQIQNADQFYEDQFRQVQQQAAAVGMPTGRYIESRLTAPGSSFIFDPVSQTYMDLGEYQIYQQERAIARARSNAQLMLTSSFQPGLSSGVTMQTPRPPMAPPGVDYAGGGGGVVANDILGQYGQVVTQPNATAAYTAVGGSPGAIESGIGPGAQSRAPEPPGFFPFREGANPQADLAQYTQETQALTAALKEQVGAYYPLIEGINSAHDAQEMFYQSQQNILAEQSVYSGQISEYTGQQNALKDAYDLLSERQANGIALTREEQELIDKYPELYARVTGGVEDATIAEGLLAVQYIENMKRGDELNRTMAGNTDATRALVDVIYELILSLDGIPEEVRSRIEIERAQESLGELQGIAAWLNSLDGFTANAYVNVTRTGIAVGNPDGPSIVADAWGMNGLTAYAHGGTVYDPLMPRFANGGTWALVGEVGPELVKLSRGDQVMPTGASQAQMRRMGRQGRGDVHVNGPVYLTPQTADLYGEFNQAFLSDYRNG